MTTVYALNAPVSESESDVSSRQDFLVDDTPGPDETVAEQIDGERRVSWLYSALKVLNERELRIVKERRLRENGATLEALGSSLGISKERVRQIENRAMEKLRDALLRAHPDRASFV